MKIRVYSITQQNGKIIKKVELIDNSLEAMQQFVGGYIEKIPLIPEKGIVILCDEDASYKRSMLTSSWELSIKGIEKTTIGIKGNHFICKEENYEIISLTDRDIKAVKQIEREIPANE